MKEATSWHSERLGRQVRLVRWGHWGTPVLLFPTAGGDAEEAERNGMIETLWTRIEAGKLKVFSTDSIPAAEVLSGSLPSEWGGKRLTQFDAAIAEEVVPAIRADCNDDGIEIVTAGSSIGAFHALALLARHPDLVRAAICLSGTYDVERLLGLPNDGDAFFSLPHSFLPGLEGPVLDALQERYVILAHGQGEAEEPNQSWGVAELLGKKGIPNRVYEWGPEWKHDWPTWRAMLPIYLDEVTG